VLARFCSTHNELAAEKLLVVKFRDCTFGFFDRVHLHESEPFGTLIMFIADNLGVLNLTDAVEELEQIALRRIEREIAHVETRGSNFNALWFTRNPRGLLPLRLRPIASRCLSRAFPVAKKSDDL